MTKFILLCAGLLVIAADFVPAPDLDAPHVYRKACVYCKDCTPVCERIDLAGDLSWGLLYPVAPIPPETSFVDLRTPSTHCDCYRCQRTGGRMVFDSVGVVEWGLVILVLPTRTGDTLTIIADTSGVRRIE